MVWWAHKGAGQGLVNAGIQGSRVSTIDAHSFAVPKPSP